MKKKKGFTLVEILSVIILIGLLIGIGIPGVKKISERMKNKSYNTKVDIIEQAAILYGQDNKTRLQSDNCKINGIDYNCVKTTMETLLTENYLEYDNYDEKIFNNPIDDSDMINKCVYIYKKNNRVYAYYSKENYCTIIPPTFIPSDGQIKSDQAHNYPFNLQIKQQMSEEEYETKFKIDNQEFEKYTNDLQITTNQTIIAKTCYKNKDICSKEAKYVAKILNVAGDIHFILTPEPIETSDNKEGWNVDEVKVEIEALNAEEITYRYGEEGDYLKYDATNGITINEITGNSGKNIYTKAKWGIIEKEAKKLIKLRKEMGQINIKASDNITSNNLHTSSFNLEISCENADKIEYSYGNKTTWKEYTEKITISEPTSSKTLYVRTSQEGFKNYKENNYIVKMKGKLGEIFITPSDDIASNSWHNNLFYLEIKSENADKIEYRYGESGTYKNYSSAIFITDETASKTLYVKATQDTGTTKTKQYIVKYDKTAPSITNYSVSYDTDTSIATLNLEATDTSSKISYQFTSRNVYDDTSWIKSNEKTINITYDLNEAQDATYYVFLKDEAGNISSSSKEVRNCYPIYVDIYSRCKCKSGKDKQTCIIELKLNNPETLYYSIKASNTQAIGLGASVENGELYSNYYNSLEKYTKMNDCNTNTCGLSIYTDSARKNLCYEDSKTRSGCD